MTSSSLRISGIWDNHHRGSIGDFLKEKLFKGSDLSFVSVYFTIYPFQMRTAAGLQSGRDFVIPDKQEQATDASDFELITWLVIKSGKN